MKTKINLLIVLVVLLQLFSPMINSVFADEDKDIKLVINGVKIVSDVPPVLQENHVLVPIRIVSETLGAQVDYTSKTREITITTCRD